MNVKLLNCGAKNVANGLLYYIGYVWEVLSNNLDAMVDWLRLTFESLLKTATRACDAHTTKLKRPTIIKAQEQAKILSNSVGIFLISIRILQLGALEFDDDVGSNTSQEALRRQTDILPPSVSPFPDNSVPSPVFSHFDPLSPDLPTLGSGVLARGRYSQATPDRSVGELDGCWTLAVRELESQHAQGRPRVNGTGGAWAPGGVETAPARAQTTRAAESTPAPGPELTFFYSGTFIHEISSTDSAPEVVGGRSTSAAPTLRVWAPPEPSTRASPKDKGKDIAATSTPEKRTRLQIRFAGVTLRLPDASAADAKYPLTDASRITNRNE
ncbi:hypothetical protein B0H14DRAFT_3886201 [Mycena olivaceomarginata]|nr:hypothetical protein B0H14DRAFT_3886201 [Mycena olivaceomarginata]